MKILFLSVNLREKGGIQRYDSSLLKALSDNGAEIILVQRQKGNFIPKIIFILQVFVKALFSNPDFIIASHVNFSPLCFFLKRLFGKEYVILAYGIEVWNMKEAVKIRALKESKKIIAISNYTG